MRDITLVIHPHPSSSIVLHHHTSASVIRYHHAAASIIFHYHPISNNHHPSLSIILTIIIIAHHLSSSIIRLIHLLRQLITRMLQSDIVPGRVKAQKVLAEELRRKLTCQREPWKSSCQIWYGMDVWSENRNLKVIDLEAKMFEFNLIFRWPTNEHF